MPDMINGTRMLKKKKKLKKTSSDYQLFCIHSEKKPAYMKLFVHEIDFCRNFIFVFGIFFNLLF